MKHRMLILTVMLAGSVVAAPFASGVAADTSRAATRASQSAPQPAVLQGIEALRQGRRLLKGGKAAEALPLLESALKTFIASDAVRGQAATHDALGDLYSRQGQHRTALTHYEKAHEQFQLASNKAAIVKRVTGIGDEEFNTNLMLAKIGEAHFRAGNIAEASAAYARMGVKKPETGALGTAKKAGRFGGLVRGLGGTIKDGDVSLSTGIGVASAVSTVQQTFELYRQSILYATYELGLGRIAYHNSKLEVAKKHFTNTLSATSGNIPLIGKVGQMRRFRVAANTSLGDVALKQGDFKAALKLYTDADKGALADERPDLRWPAQRGSGKATLALAEAEKDEKKRAKMQQEGFDAYRAALKTIEDIRQGSLRADEARTTFLATTRDVFDEASGAFAAAALAATTKESAPLEGVALGYAGEAFRIVEQGRARSLLDMLSETGTTISEGISPALVQRKRDNLERQQEIVQQISGVSLTGEPPKEGIDKLEEELRTLSVAYDSLENEIRAASPRYGALTAPQPLTLVAVQQSVLDDNTMLLEYSLGRERSYLWAATKEGVTLHALPARDKLDALAMALRDRIVPQSLRRSLLDAGGGETRGLAEKRGLALAANATAANVASFAEASHALYQNTIAPVASGLKNRRLLVVADGALNYVPFESLVTAPLTTGAGGDYSTLAYLVKTNEVIYAPSASVVDAIRKQSAGGANQNARGLLVVADPIFDASDPRAKSPQASATQPGDGGTLAVDSAVADITGASSNADGSSSSSNFKLARLNGTRAEAEQIKRLALTSGLTPDIWLDLDASESRVKAADASKYRFLHVATHGLLNTERPQFTGVVLSLVGNREGDGFLRTDEIFNLKLGSPLVMLSACETGLGRERRGEGVIGLTRAFMYAGAPTVGVSLWSVSDSSTADLMIDFYKRLLAKASPAASPVAAMRASQLSMIAGKKYSAPFHWAPFVLVGDWR